MSLKVQKRTIDGHVYVVTQLATTPAVELANKLMAAIAPVVSEAAPVIGRLRAAYQRGGMAAAFDVDFGALTGAVRQLFAALPPNEHTAIISALFGGEGKDSTVVLYDGGKAVPLKPGSGPYEEHFSGNIFALHKVVAFALEVNFRDFFDAWSRQEKRRRAIEEAIDSPGPTTSSPDSPPSGSSAPASPPTPS